MIRRHYTTYYLALLVLLLTASACGEYMRVQQSTDVTERYSYAKKYYNTGKYKQAAELLETVVPYLRGTGEGETSLYLLAKAYYADKDYKEAADVFQKYYTTYPNGEYTELARYYSGYGLAQQMPDPRLDQEPTYRAIKELQLFLDYYPQSEKAKEATQLLFDLQENLALKELLNVQLYYNLGNYIFNNYESAIITGRNALKAYPYSKYKEDIHYYILSSLYEIAKNSIESKQQQRLRDLRDEYFAFVNEFPEGKRRKQADEYYAFAYRLIEGEQE